ncbi:MAG: PAS domain S-box protein [Candidatus Omnitrophica bacterium]|nr:PAS domain S-box protein [Candidatus Omnitrophota bacterium]
MHKPLPNHKHFWAGALLALLAIICYSSIFFALNESAHTLYPFVGELYLISIVFLLIMTLIILITSRAQTHREQDLRETEQQYRDLIQHAADPIIILDHTGIILSANSAVEKMSGYRPEELINRHFLKVNILVGNSIRVAAKEFIHILQQKTRPPFELSILNKNGNLWISEANARRTKDVSGKTIVHVTLRDITARKKVEETLRQERNNAQNYLNIAGVIILTLNKNGLVTLINKKGCELLGYEEKEIVGQDWFKKFLSADEEQEVRIIFNRMLSGQDKLPPYLEYSVVTKNGTKRLLSWHNTLIRDENNNIVGTLGSGQDITDQQSIENQLHLQSTALEAAANAIVITNKAGKIVWANHALTEISGYQLDEVLGKNLNIFKSGLHNERFYENLWQTILAGKIWHGEIINRRKDDRLYTEEMTITPVRNRVGDIQHFIAIKHDVTERKSLQQGLEQANIKLEANGRKLERTLQEMAVKNKELQEAQNQLIQNEKLAAIGVLSSGIAHEIKNPLAIISLSIEEFEGLSEKLDDQSKAYIKMIKSAATRANNVIIELLRFARVSDLKVESINLYDLIEGTFILINNSTKFKGITLEHKYTDKNIHVPGDRILLEQVLFNLLINATDSTERGGTITVTTYLQKPFSSFSEHEEIIIEVSDNGSGIAPEVLPRIFEPFFTTKDQGKGTGLGLSTVYTLLKRHHGTINVTSTLGVGTTFTITLPLVTKTTN